MIDQLRQIAIFAKTVDHGSFRGAARELRLSPSVVSHHISQLEDHLGVALLYRSTRKLALTAEGKRLLVSAQHMLETVQNGLSDISMSASQPTGELRITLPSILSESQLTTAISHFAMTYPGIKLSLNFTDTRQELIEDGFDLAIRMSINRKKSPTSKMLFLAERCALAATEYKATQHKPKTPDDLSDWNWIELSPVFHVKPTFTKLGAKPVTIRTTGQINANDARALYHLVLSGAGIAIVPKLLAEDDIASGRIKIVLPDWDMEPIKVFAEWPTNAPRKGLVRLLVEYLSQELSQT